MPFSERLRMMWSLPRDKADTLLLLATCAIVLLPHSGHLPYWTPPLCFILLLWRGWITWSGRRMPPRSLLALLAGAVLLAVYATFRTVFGQEAGVTMLVLLLTVKLLEMRARRDLFVVLFLCLFLLLAHFFYSQSIFMALYTVAAVVLLVATQLTFQYADAVPPLAHRLRKAATIVGLAAPLTIVMFVLFPRIQGPLWGMPRDAGSGLSGLSDTMAPGNITQLALSDDIAFRVRFIDPEPAPSKLYWRGVVLGDYDGRTWRPLPAGVPRGQATLRVRGKAVRHEITLEPNGKRWLFTLELPIAPPRLNDRDTFANGDLQLLASRPVAERVRYEAVSYSDFDLLMAGTRTTLRAWRELPEGFNPQTLAFAARLRRDYSDDDKLVEATLRHFRTEKFYYTLEPPALGRDEIDDFLFRTRAGFCEHYASAFTVLMRAAGIPARVVTGYQGGTDNPVDGYMVVRQSDAHAWAEVWLADRGWVRVDPTAAVAPERVLQGTGSVLPRRALGGLITIGTSGSDWLSRLRFNWDAITNRWNQWVLSYSMDRQQSLLRALGFSDPDWRTLMGLLAAVGSVVLGVIAFPLLRNRQRPDPVNACYRALCDAMARRGLPRALHEGPHAYRERLAADASLLDAQRKAAAMRFLQVYAKIQYGVVDKAARTAALSELKSLLSTCR